MTQPDASLSVTIIHHGEVISIPSELLVFKNRGIPFLLTLGGAIIASWDAVDQEWRCESNGSWAWCKRNAIKETA